MRLSKEYFLARLPLYYTLKLDMVKLEQKSSILLENGESVEGTFPLIVSASRSTDIPAFYTDWFFDRLKKGYSVWTNPFNNKRHYIGYEEIKFIIFWSKNPRPLLKHLDYLKERKIGCYIQFTLNDYEADKLERGVPPLADRIETFKMLIERLGKGSVIWRFDPLLLTDTISIDTLLARIENIGEQLHKHTEKLVFSFADILSYNKVKANLERNRIPYHDWTISQMREFAERLVDLNQSKGWNLQLATCGEVADLPGIEHNKCVDDRLILRLCPRSPELLKFLGAEIRNSNTLFGSTSSNGIDLGNGSEIIIVKTKKDTGQREACGCVKSKDIGEYNTCPHLCEYCYANASKESAMRNYQRHKENQDKDTITGR